MPKKNTGMWKNKNKYSRGGKTYGVNPSYKRDFFNSPNRPTQIAEIQEGLGQVRPGMATGGGTEVGKKVQSYQEYVKKMFGGGETGNKKRKS